MIKKNILIWMTAALAFCACSSSENNGDEGEIDPPSPHAVPIKISTTMESVDGTRATDYGFEAGDRIGLFVVNHNADGTPGTLQPVGNHVDNMRFTYSGTWTPDEQIYWKDETTHADFYLYYPYTPSLTSVNAMPFSTMANQSNTSDYKASDLLVGITKDVAPTEAAVGIYNPQIQISAESETKRSIFREKDKTKRSKKESAQHSKSRNKSFVMTSVSAL